MQGSWSNACKLSCRVTARIYKRIIDLSCCNMRAFDIFRRGSSPPAWQGHFASSCLDILTYVDATFPKQEVQVAFKTYDTCLSLQECDDTLPKTCVRPRRPLDNVTTSKPFSTGSQQPSQSIPSKKADRVCDAMLSYIILLCVMTYHVLETIHYIIAYCLICYV